MSRYIDADEFLVNESEAYMNAQIKLAKENADKTIDHNRYINLLVHKKIQMLIADTPSIDIVRCKECVYYDPPHVEDDGKRIEYKDLPKEAFDPLGTGLVNMSYGVNIGGRCCVDYNCGYAEDKRVYRAEDNFCSRGKREGADDE